MINDIIKIHIESVKQPVGTMYIGKIDGQLLYSMSKVDIRRINELGTYCGMQRELDNRKVKSIKKYIKSFDSSFPNSIILNLDSKYIIDKKDDYIEVCVNENAFTIIDGQHRLSGFSDYDLVKEFELVVTIFIDLDQANQANIFKTINSEQRKVDPSLTFDLEEYDKYETPRKFSREIAMMFNSDPKSPWYKRIKIIGKKDIISTNASISSKAFTDQLLKNIYRDDDYYLIRNKLNNYKDVPRNLIFNEDEYDNDEYIFWELYVNDEKVLLYKILLNYFKAVESCLYSEWTRKDSILVKAIGYNAIMSLFKDIYNIAIKEGDFTEKNFTEILSPLKEMKDITSEKFGSSGTFTTKRIYNEMKQILNLE